MDYTLLFLGIIAVCQIIQTVQDLGWIYKIQKAFYSRKKDVKIYDEPKVR